MNIYILNTENPERWGDEAYNGMEIPEDEVKWLSKEWAVPVSELKKELITIDTDQYTKVSTLMKLMAYPADIVEVYNTYHKHIDTVYPGDAKKDYGDRYIEQFNISEDNDGDTVLEIVLLTY